MQQTTMKMAAIRATTKAHTTPRTMGRVGGSGLLFEAVREEEGGEGGGGREERNMSFTVIIKRDYSKI